ncbi:uncharacterized protein LOC125861240 [Solanum stenotomum]|uniref:uncharacterized protein LOC125861240 n=1 Tax=Solanum stenotomum TaxID=172797 RepID=UPI0020D16B96|nr:uncharacterized protein LOC125861240 [Solanum stenotomum]
MAANIHDPWGVIGDFNVISTREEKIRGRPHRLEETMDFIDCLNECGLQDAGFTGPKVTWCDHKDPPHTIWKRLDRLVYNDSWFDNLNNTSVIHFSRTCSDHAPPLVDLLQDQSQGNPLYIFQQKIKNTTKTLSGWSRETFGDIYEEPKRLEKLIRDLEEKCITYNSPENRCELSKHKDIFTRYLKIQDSILSQKARVKWFNEGDANTAYFHATIKDKRRRLNIRKIQDDNDNWLEDTDAIANGAVNYYRNLFAQDSTNTDFSSLDCVDSCITKQDNLMINAFPELKEVMDTVFSIDPNSSPGPDGLSGMFYHKCWSIISLDVHNAIISFFK